MERHEGVPEGPLDPLSSATDDELLEAAGVAEGDPAADEVLTATEEELGEGHFELAAQRDEYLEALQRVMADFDNFKKRTARERIEMVDRAQAQLAEKLLVVLDACEAALAHGAAETEPIHKSLLEVLEKSGLERMEPVGEPFDPNLHDAVMHEEGDVEHPVVVEGLRTGYLWKTQVLRPAMVKVRG